MKQRSDERRSIISLGQGMLRVKKPLRRSLSGPWITSASWDLILDIL